VLAGEGRAGGDEVGGCALEGDPAAVVARAEVDESVVNKLPAAVGACRLFGAVV
jgi:hypothetical protein